MKKKWLLCGGSEALPLLLLSPSLPPSRLIVYFLNHCKQMPSVSLAAVICTLIT